MNLKSIQFSRRASGILASLLVGFSLTLTSCDDNENPTTTPPAGSSTITDLVVAGDQFTFLEEAVKKAGLTTTLSGTGPFTVFAPTDDAFRAAGFADAAAVGAAADTTLRRILLYHVVGGSYPASAIQAGQTALPTSLSVNGTTYVTKATSTSGTGVSVNGARVITADVQATNGVVHAIDRVLMPPTGNVLQVAQADTSLSLLGAAVARGGAAVVTALSGATPLTVFAPTNAAFRATPYNTVAAINAAPVAALTAILTNHVVVNPGRAYSPTIVSGPITTFGTGSVTATVGTGNALTLLSPGNGGQASTVLQNTTGVQNRDITATNGVVHKIDRVLLP
ncbi:fasciclin domain-containing protein [Spirosoma fluviale]|uniref:Uncaracterized surface protein containing fasciclin (FAS1) repeats n=1 Tax=Spirosoma fluviale TaxID=1597977 RepID=A0A286GCG2_9BACT|nr:fasciclin domain-containing protein [Spirosoma fluviale]SOD92809.1 Uncaracterized surface protein containing fasciclin (FAS1) repeats [Spirosoma fluviale]